MLWTTVALMASVVAGTLVLGAGLAWLVGHYRFPGQRWFSWLLVLPLAIPAYVLGFVYLGLLDHPGPVQTALRGWFGVDVWFPEVRSMTGAIVALSLTLYPYVYLLARAALRDQHPGATEGGDRANDRPEIARVGDPVERHYQRHLSTIPGTRHQVGGDGVVVRRHLQRQPLVDDPAGQSVKLRARHLDAHHAGADPGRCPRRPADPAEGQGRAGRTRWSGR